jgi:hypothetical protein
VIRRITFANGSYLQWYDPRLLTTRQSPGIRVRNGEVELSPPATAMLGCGENERGCCEGF